MSEPKQRGDRRFNRGRQHPPERTEPRVREPDGEADERDARQSTFDDVTSPNEHDLVKRTDRQDASDHHYPKGRRGQQTLLRQRGAQERCRGKPSQNPRSN